MGISKNLTQPNEFSNIPKPHPPKKLLQDNMGHSTKEKVFSVLQIIGLSNQNLNYINIIFNILLLKQ